jgi:hypothetical protein
VHAALALRTVRCDQQPSRQARRGSVLDVEGRRHFSVTASNHRAEGEIHGLESPLITTVRVSGNHSRRRGAGGAGSGGSAGAGVGASGGGGTEGEVMAGRGHQAAPPPPHAISAAPAAVEIEG